MGAHLHVCYEKVWKKNIFNEAEKLCEFVAKIRTKTVMSWKITSEKCYVENEWVPDTAK